VRDSAFVNSTKAESVTAAEGKEGDAGAILALAPNFRLGVGRVSSKWWGDGGVKKVKTNNTTISASAGGIGGLHAKA